ncbi:MAG: hypothetical protein JSS78_00955 [Bacteroidetes bacterium]|nr:hypothetical protein [Bacteroidota bacterium]
MKKLRFALALFLLSGLFQSCKTNAQQTAIAPPSDTVTYQQFYDQLSPYGRWIEYPGYGYVWSPNDAGFIPYSTNGYWVYTNWGWGWNSNYSWGWAPFHYGRWFYETGYGWCWVPGYSWAPAWVMWRTGGVYYGWAPLPPGIGVGVSFGIPFEHWCFVDHRYLGVRNFSTYLLPTNRIEEVYNHTSIINNINITDRRVSFAAGPSRTEVEKYSGQAIHPITIRENHVPEGSRFDENKSELHLYRPAITQTPVQREMQPRTSTRFQDIPRSNGQRGTWSGMERMERETPRMDFNSGRGGMRRGGR